MRLHGTGDGTDADDSDTDSSDTDDASTKDPCPVLSLATVRPGGTQHNTVKLPKMEGWFFTCCPLVAQRTRLLTQTRGKEPESVLSCCPLCGQPLSRHDGRSPCTAVLRSTHVRTDLVLFWEGAKVNANMTSRRCLDMPVSRSVGSERRFVQINLVSTVGKKVTRARHIE